MERARVQLLREVLSSTGWIDRTHGFARSLRRSTEGTGELLLVGTATEEPWHLAAHLDEEARFADLPGLSPTLVRWAPPPDAPAHLSVGLDRLVASGRGETVFVVAPDTPTEGLLERVADARRAGATVLALDVGDADLADLAHDELIVPASGLFAPGEHSGLTLPMSTAGLSDLDLSLPDVSFETVQHLVSAAAGEPDILLAAIAGTPVPKG
ncbi:MAG: hypothetical protein ABI468_06900, partial [Candidatus Nanopelagicales bacterium]